MYQRKGGSNVETVHQIQFLMNENSKVTIKTEEKAFAPILIKNLYTNKEFQSGKSLYNLITESLVEFLTAMNKRPTLDSPIRVNFQVFDKDGIKEYTIFGFYTYPISEQLDVAYFDEEVVVLDDIYKKKILGI